MIRQYELVDRVKGYDPAADEALLNRAYVFSMKAHGSQKRASGDPYFSHPLEVAGILTDMRLDSDTIVTALLHDTVEDTNTTINEIKELFGDKIAQMVDGVTKLSQIKINPDQDLHAENFRKFVLAMSDDMRVLLVKLADRLHNMRTLNHIKKPEKRRRIALETMEIYAPLAERIGMREMKDELEHISFGELDAEALESVETRLEFLREKAGNIKEIVIRELEERLAAEGVEARVLGREKKPFSIWTKMERNHVSFEQLSDVMGFRIIVEDIPTCYKAVGVVHDAWPSVLGLFKDYISTPKPNNYQSIHTTVIGPERQRIEIQIRTQEMNDIAELGVAAHWKYKQQGTHVDGVQFRWLQELLEILEHAESPEEFLEHTKLAMYRDQVFCFTPKGDLITLPRDATPVDFAYAVHSDVGNTCVGAKVNGLLVPLRHQLKNGDQVEILRSTAQKPAPRWESFVVTGKARSAIRKFRRQNERREYAELGRGMIETALAKQELEVTPKALRAVLPKLADHKLEEVEDLYVHVGQGHIEEDDVMTALFPGMKRKKPRRAFLSAVRVWGRKDKTEENAQLPIVGLTPGMAVHLSDCCHPLPGERIVGIKTAGKGIDIHTIDCEELAKMDDESDRWLDVKWQSSEQFPEMFTGQVKLVASNEMGALASITTVVAKTLGNISNLKLIEREQKFITMVIDIEVVDVRHLTNIITALRAIRIVSSVERYHA